MILRVHVILRGLTTEMTLYIYSIYYYMYNLVDLSAFSNLSTIIMPAAIVCLLTCSSMDVSFS